MTPRSSLSLWVLGMVVALLLPSVALAQPTCPTTPEPFTRAAWLAGRGEAFQAASLYLDVLYRAQDSAQRRVAYDCLLRVYVGAGELDRARALLVEVARSGAMPPSLAMHLELDLASLEVRGRQPDAALVRLSRIPDGGPVLDRRRAFLRGLALAEKDDLPAAAVEFQAAAETCSVDRTKECGLSRRNLLVLAEAPGEKSPAVAVALSAVVPGAGFWYAEDGFDALLHGASTLLVGWLAFDSWHGDRSWSEQRAGTYVLSALALTLYGSNLVASHDGAQRLNDIRREERRRNLQLGADPVPLPLADTGTSAP
ncbi:MAG: hypothetical protein ACOYOB_10400 [Myxococcota bacterium]